MERRAKIVATLGPASRDPETFRRMLGAGVDVVRLNLSHGTREDHSAMIAMVRRISAEEGRIVPVFADLMGPRYRLGPIAEGPKTLEPETMVTLGGVGDDVDLPFEEPQFLEHLRPGERVLIDNGLVELEVTRIGRDRVEASVRHGGPVSTRKGINLPDTDLPFTITEKDLGDIQFAVREKVDFLAISFVGSPDDVEAVRRVVRGLGGYAPLIAKLERATVTQHIDRTVQAADAVMVARGDLGVEVPLHRVPVLQKQIIAAGRLHGKPVIVATQMLESMMQQPRPTRAESSDVANAVFDRADALMLSGETAAGEFPVEAVRTMGQIILESETYRLPPLPSGRGTAGLGPLAPGDLERTQMNASRDLNLDIPEVICAAAVHATSSLQVSRIVAFSQGGFTARMLGRYRPRPGLTVFTRDSRIAHQVQLIWGARPLLMDVEVEHHDEVVSVVDRLLLEQGLAEPGDRILILMGDPIHERPLTNLMRIHVVKGI